MSIPKTYTEFSSLLEQNRWRFPKDMVASAELAKQKLYEIEHSSPEIIEAVTDLAGPLVDFAQDYGEWNTR